MFGDLDIPQLEQLIKDQSALARIAVSPDVQAMHRELEALYRSQLACTLASEKLGIGALSTNLKLAA